MSMLLVSREAQEYIMLKGGAVTVRMIKGQGGCCAMLSPVIDLGRPTDPSDYQHFHEDGVDFYLQEGLKILPGGVRLSLNKLLWIKKIDVRGLEILP